MTKPALTAASKRLSASLASFRDDERGMMALFMLFIFVLMFLFGGIAVDVMRFETRRVALQQTMDRAALAAASLTQTRDGKVIAEEWFDKAKLADSSYMAEFSEPVVKAINDAGLRRVTIDASVRSHNFFMDKFTDDPFLEYLEGPSLSEAAQGVSQIEVMMVLDISGSMDDPATANDTKKKIEALRDSATEFVNTVKGNDSKNQISIGYVPYNAQVNLPTNLRQQFTVSNLSHWGGVANQGVPYINCIEIPTGTYSVLPLSRTTSMRMAAVADTQSGFETTGNYRAPSNGVPTTDPLNRICNTLADNAGTPHDERSQNHVMLPTKNAATLVSGISHLTQGGYTSIAIGMRWGTALLDESARPIYTAIGDSSVAGRPVDNDDIKTRKIIILMTDGEHVSTNHVKDSYKSGLSPIYKGADGRYAMRFWSSGVDLNNNTRPTCQGVNVNTTSRQYFIPHLKEDWVDLNSNGVENSGERGACDRDAWVTSPTWTGSGTVRQLDWSEVWADMRLSYMTRQIYMRSNVTDTGNYDTVMNTFRQGYIAKGTLDTLLQSNCSAARAEGIEIYGIAFAAPEGGKTQINGCSSSPKENYYFDASDSAKLSAAFRMIATDISDLRLTQ